MLLGISPELMFLKIRHLLHIRIQAIHIDRAYLLFPPTAESFGGSAQIGSGVVRGGPDIRFHQGSTRVPQGSGLRGGASTKKNTACCPIFLGGGTPSGPSHFPQPDLGEAAGRRVVRQPQTPVWERGGRRRKGGEGETKST